MNIWTDVAYDTDSAQRAVDLLERVANELDARTRSRENLAQHARRGWSGATRAAFDRQVLELALRSEDLSHRLRRAATTIEDDLNAAIAEQRGREQRRAEIRAADQALLAPA